MAEENNGSWPNQQTPQSSEQPHDEQPNQTPQIVEGDQFTMTAGGEATNAEQPTETIPAAAPSAAESASSAAPAGPSAEPAPAGPAPAAAPAPQSPYRPAPEYGAYGPTPTQPAAQQHPQSAPTQQMPPQNNRNPYLTGNPFLNGNNGPANQEQGGAAPNNAPTNPFMAPVNGPQNNGNGPSSPQGSIFPPVPGSGAPKPNRGGGRTVSGVIIAVVVALVSAALCLGVGYMAITEGWVKVPTTSSLQHIDSGKSGDGSAPITNGEAVDWAAVADKVSQSVVSIQTTLQNGTAAGSGAIIDEQGHIVTNNHVISGAQNIQVTLSNGQMYTAQVTGTDTTTDLAVIQLDDAPDGLVPVEFADSDTLAVGEPVMAIGNPLGYDDTATTGIVSALNRPVSVMDDNNSQIVTNAVQIDAAINPGNSGGPTFNATGQVIGINSSIASTASSSSEAGSIGIGFAIPSNLVKRVSDEIIQNGQATHVALGVTITSDTVEADGVVRGGARITTPSTGGKAVVSGSPADKAGLQANDTIVAFNGNAVNNNYSLLGFVRAASLGDTVTLTIVRGGKTMDVDVTLDQQEEAVNGSNRTEQNNGSGQQDQQNQQDQNGQQDQQGNGYDDGGLFDPFGFW